VKRKIDRKEFRRKRFWPEFQNFLGKLRKLINEFFMFSVPVGIRTKDLRIKAKSDSTSVNLFGISFLRNDLIWKLSFDIAQVYRKIIL
jgi:hypothetical protein